MFRNSATNEKRIVMNYCELVKLTIGIRRLCYAYDQVYVFFSVELAPAPFMMDRDIHYLKCFGNMTNDKFTTRTKLLTTKVLFTVIVQL